MKSTPATPAASAASPPSADPWSIESWAELALDWQRAFAECSAWWIGAARAAQFAGAAPDIRREPRDDRVDREDRKVSARRARRHAAPAQGSPFDTRELKRLHERYSSRLADLWAGATGVSGIAGAPARRADAASRGVDVPQRPAEDRRFASPAWREQPWFAWIRDAWQLYGEYLTELASLAQLPPEEKRRLEFSTRQFVDAIAPSNFPATNPDVIARAIATEGASLVQGMRNLGDDIAKGRITMSDESAFTLGRNLAVTPGSVVLRNPLIELIQYAPTTSEVSKRPLLIIPPCINKYYILDLTPANSFVRHAVAEGHTVFIVSWRNIPEELGKLTWDDYLEQGVLAALAAVKSIADSDEVNTLGFCVGGTLLAAALAVLAARGDRSVTSATFLTTMLDFADPGEIGVYISAASLDARKPLLCAGERVPGSELAGAFASLRANELVWNYVVNNYLKGRTPPAFDLLYWNGDSSNLPGPMYWYYINEMYIGNRLRVPDALTMLGQPIDLRRLAMPMYVYASREDHIVPWRSAWRTVGLVGTRPRFVLGASGHIAGVVNPPAAGKRNYWTGPLPSRGMGSETWLARATSHAGSWWPDWHAWLAKHGGGKRPAPAAAGNAAHPPLGPAPGTYVLAAAK
ncbi:MAG: class I poly(R)-hydroxyalkanoic acid synthase [Proteobacteria bacterium]|nr:class I poly(R)-hydroxyalkanoic acid synthase [Pseudomonadota bacterium]